LVLFAETSPAADIGIHAGMQRMRYDLPRSKDFCPNAIIESRRRVTQNTNHYVPPPGST